MLLINPPESQSPQPGFNHHDVAISRGILAPGTLTENEHEFSGHQDWRVDECFHCFVRDSGDRQAARLQCFPRGEWVYSHSAHNCCNVAYLAFCEREKAA